MKKINIALLSLALLTGVASCEDQLDVTNPNAQTTDDFGQSANDINELVIACYHHCRMEGTSSRLGYMWDMCAADQVNSFSDNDWWRGVDYLNTNETSDMTSGIFQHWFYVVNSANQVLYKAEEYKDKLNEDDYNQIMGQGYFFRGLAYWELTTHFQHIPLITDYKSYDQLDNCYQKSHSQVEVLAQCVSDLTNAMNMLPSKDKGGEWALGRATKGSAAAFLARVYMFDHEYQKAYDILDKFINGEYGHYELMADYGDNFKEGPEFENNAESIWEIQYLDYGQQGSDHEWTPVNNSKNPTQGQALETVFASGDFGGWNDLGATPWTYQLFKSQEAASNNKLGFDKRLYWTLASYEEAYNSVKGYSNTIYKKQLTKHQTTGAYQGLSVVKHTTARQNLYKAIPSAGLSCGVNLRIIRYSDILLRAAECINEIQGPTQKAIDYINMVRKRAGLVELELSDFSDKDKLFEQIANVERPTEFACEKGRLNDLIRWGFFYDDARLKQLRQHACCNWKAEDPTVQPESYTNASDDPISHYTKGHEYLPIFLNQLNGNYNLSGNSANITRVFDDGTDYISNYNSKVPKHQVVDLSK